MLESAISFPEAAMPCEHCQRMRGSIMIAKMERILTIVALCSDGVRAGQGSARSSFEYSGEAIPVDRFCRHLGGAGPAESSTALAHRGAPEV